MPQFIYMANEILLLLTGLLGLGFGTGFFKLVDMYLAFYSKKNDFTKLQSDLKIALASIAELQKDKVLMHREILELHTQINDLKEENATFRGLLSSQTDRDELIKELLSKNKKK